MEEDKVTLAGIKGGAVEEMFQRALEKTLENMSDLNTDTKTARKIMIEVTLTPNEDRDTVAIEAKVNTKLPADKPETTTFYMGRVGGKFIAREHDPKQHGLFSAPEPAKFPVAQKD